MSYVFKKTIDITNEFSQANIIYEIPNDDLTIDELVEHFKCFLQACSFCIDGEIVYCQKENDDKD